MPPNQQRPPAPPRPSSFISVLACRGREDGDPGAAKVGGPHPQLAIAIIGGQQALERRGEEGGEGDKKGRHWAGDGLEDGRAREKGCGGESERSAGLPPNCQPAPSLPRPLTSSVKPSQVSVAAGDSGSGPACTSRCSARHGNMGAGAGGQEEDGQAWGRACTASGLIGTEPSNISKRPGGYR